MALHSLLTDQVALHVSRGKRVLLWQCIHLWKKVSVAPSSSLPLFPRSMQCIPFASSCDPFVSLMWKAGLLGGPVASRLSTSGRGHAYVQWIWFSLFVTKGYICKWLGLHDKGKGVRPSFRPLNPETTAVVDRSR